MKKTGKENQKITASPIVKKIPNLHKDFVPANMLKTLRENVPIICPSNKINENQEYIPIANPFALPPEWIYNNDEDVNKEIFSSDQIFNDPFHDEIMENIPVNLMQVTNNAIQWIRPYDYNKNNLIL